MKALRITHNHFLENPHMDAYLNEISKHELLTSEEEARLAKRIREGDMEALEKLVKGNLRFVVSVAKQYQNMGLPVSDLINEGNLGLIRAAYKFDESRGFKFISYAVWWIRQAIMQAIVEQARIVRLPAHKVNAYMKITRAFQQFEQDYQREPEVEDLMQMLGMSKEEINEYFKANSTTVSTEAVVPGSEDMKMGDNICDTDNNPEEELMQETFRTTLKDALAKFTEREAEIICSYYGLEGREPMTLEEIGAKYGLTRERVRQIKERCIEKLKKLDHVSILQECMQQ
ncbi:MAG: RNA polymerase sigma factor RpoD/SigA [Chitinophagales bacterium]|nr:RNA polymerase sigma factor RpoD/SigA [Chitinophagales bacterium]MDW8418845.1 RNA polymerase sigma factor RpoD/SigA [Chitinophagales bacterium]